MAGLARIIVPAAALLVVLMSNNLVRAQTPAQPPVAEEFERLHFRSIGPAVMSGRIASLAVYEADPAIYYVGTAHGGVWKTTSNGALFEPQFQDQGLISIGAVEISQRNPDLVWVGAGEANNRQSTSWGGGVWKSTDGGRTWEHMGLAQSYHINAIAMHPANENTVLVAATGPIFGAGGDRGIFKTTDGGRTWRQVLQVDDDTGANALVFSRTNPNVLYASTYQRRRAACCMNGGGPGSGIWKSSDGGENWTRLTGGGLPGGEIGRIGLDVFRGDDNIVFASIEAPGGAGGFYRTTDGGQTWTRVNSANPRPMYFSKVRVDPTTPDRVYMGGVGLYMSIDGGTSFHPDAAQSTHDDVHAIWVNPANPSHILIGNDGGLAVSYDMSKTWQFLPNLPVGTFYHVWYDMERPYNVCGGLQDNYSWCGPSAVRLNRGIMNYDWVKIQGGDGFVVMPDPRDSRIIYAESQNGNITRRDRVTGESKSIRPTAANVVNAEPNDRYRWNWDTPVVFSPHEPGTLLVAAQRVFRSADRGDSWTAISPDLTSNASRDTIALMGVMNRDTRIARNDGVSAWPTIVSLAESPVQPGLYYTGTDDGTVSVSRDGGEHWENITSRLPGFPARGYVSEVVPSRFAAGRVYVAVDNHWHNDYEPYIWVSEDYGRTFRSLRGDLSGQNVRTLTEDQRNPDVLYIGTETGIFLTLDRGQTWRRLKSSLPTVRVDEITLHPRDNAMIVATHGRSIFILDHLEPIQEYAAARQASSPGTLFSVPTSLQWKTMNDRNDEFWGHQWFAGENQPFDAVIQYYLPRQANEVKLVISDLAGRHMRELNASPQRSQPGIQTVCWDMRIDPIRTPPQQPAAAAQAAAGRGAAAQRQQTGRANIPGVPTPMPSPGYRPRNICAGGLTGTGGAAGPHVVPGTYNVTLYVNGQQSGTQPITIVMDQEVRLTGADRERYNTLLEAMHAEQQQGTNVAATLTSLGRSMAQVSPRLDGVANLPADVRTQYNNLQASFERVRVRFGVAAAGGAAQPAAAGRGAGAGPAGGGQQAASNALGNLGTVKNQIMGIWETPSPIMQQRAAAARIALAHAIDEAEAVLRHAQQVNQALGPFALSLEVPPFDR